MAKEKPYYREVIADIYERSGGKMVFNCHSIMDTLGVGREKAIKILAGKREISIYELVRKLID